MIKSEKIYLLYNIFSFQIKFLNDPENCNNLIDFYSKLTKNLVFLKNKTPHLTKFLTEENVFNIKFSCHKSYGTEESHKPKQVHPKKNQICSKMKSHDQLL